MESLKQCSFQSHQRSGGVGNPASELDNGDWLISIWSYIGSGPWKDEPWGKWKRRYWKTLLTVCIPGVWRSSTKNNSNRNLHMKSTQHDQYQDTKTCYASSLQISTTIYTTQQPPNVWPKYRPKYFASRETLLASWEERNDEDVKCSRLWRWRRSTV